jgi:hypothetical protein
MTEHASLREATMRRLRERRSNAPLQPTPPELHALMSRIKDI